MDRGFLCGHCGGRASGKPSQCSGCMLAMCTICAGRERLLGACPKAGKDPLSVSFQAFGPGDEIVFDAGVVFLQPEDDDAGQDEPS
jgi:hypothetical protein